MGIWPGWGSIHNVRRSDTIVEFPIYVTSVQTLPLTCVHSVFGGPQVDVQKRLAQKAADCLRWRCFENDGPNRGKMRQVARRHARRVLRQVDAREEKTPE